MKQNLVEKTQEKKFTIFKKKNSFFLKLGQTRPNHFGLGRRCQPIKQWASPLFTCNVNSGEADAEEEEEEGEREEGWPAVPHSAVGGDGGGRTRLLAVAGAWWRTMLHLLLPLSPSSVFFLICFSPSFSFLFSLLCSVFFFFFSFSLPPFFLVFLFSCALPCIYRKNRGERGRVGHCAAAPKIARGARSLFFTAPW